jgi:hypothetical protein
MASKNKYQVNMSEKGKSKRTVNGILFDSFSGSGTTAVSAHRNIDANDDYNKLAYDRMKLEFPTEFE